MNYKEYYQKNKDKIKEYKKRYYQKHKAPLLKRHKEWKINNPKEYKQIEKRYYLKNKDKILERTKKYQKENPDKIILKSKNYYNKNKDKILNYGKIWRLNNRGYAFQYNKGYYKQNKKQIIEHIIDRRKTNLQEHIRNLLRTRLRKALDYYTKTGKIYRAKEYGIDYNAIIEHLKPLPENIKEYHIDHIRPLSSFDLNDFNQIKEAFAPKNHQWLLIHDNLSKNNRRKK